MPDFLLEIGCEEIPARMLDAASLELRERVQKLLERERLSPKGAISYLDTPRRLAVFAAAVPTAQPDVTEQVNGPSVSAAFKDGQPTMAAQSFAKKAGVDVGRLERVTTPKGEYLAATVTKKGRPAAEILAELLPKEINSIYWPKNMYWHRPAEKFVRPVRWLVAMLDGEVVPLELHGVKASNQSRGHRILSNRAIQVSASGTAYVEALRAAKVLSRAEREQQIRKALDAATRTVPGAHWREDKNLLDTVVNLTEWPSVVLGNFDRQFLELPEEVLVTVMRDHQKYFAIEDANGKLLPHFLAVLNTDGDAQGIIRHGHERVLRARFNDARFFWQTDQKHPLRERVQWLKQVTFQKDLGSYYEKTQRVQRLGSWLCEGIRQKGMAVRAGIVHKAACLAKADLTTELVKEFTELQGVVGGLYARTQMLDPDMKGDAQEVIAIAIYDQYKPESMEAPVPRTVEGAMLSIADKADSIAGMFALGLQPTGSRDPFALRRQANGIVRILAEYNMHLSLLTLFQSTFDVYSKTEIGAKFPVFADYAGFCTTLKEGFQTTVKTTGDELAYPVVRFIRERLEFYLRDVSGLDYDVVRAVLAGGFEDVPDAVARATALSEVRDSAEFRSIFVSFRRMRGILEQAAGELLISDQTLDAGRLLTVAEKNLISALERIVPTVDKLRQSGRYREALLDIATVRPAIDSFFDTVMVLVDDVELRRNRLQLLRKLFYQFFTIADFSEIVTEGKG
jgi:glycyl-tRNA synthetase beta chain